MEIKYLKDNVIKKALANENKQIRNYVARLISDTTKIPLEEIKDNLELVYPEISANANIINSASDVALKNNVMYFNIEVNYSRSTTARLKGITYTFQLTIRQLKSAKLYREIMPVTQINIDAWDILGFGELLYETCLMEINHKVIYNRLITIYNINLSYFKNLDYNDIENDSLLRDLALFVINDKKFLNKLYKGDKDVNMFKNELGDLTNGFDDTYYCSDDELQRQIDLENQDIGRKEGYEQGKEEGIQEGAKEKALETAKSLLELGVNTIEQIAKVTKLSIAEVNNIKEKNLN